MLFDQSSRAVLFSVIASTFGLTQLGFSSEFMSPSEVRAHFNQNHASDDIGADVEGLEAILPNIDEVISPDEQSMLRSQRASLAPLSMRGSSFAGLQAEVDLRPRDSKVKKQFGGTCSTFGLIGAMENALDSENRINLSERHLWSMYKQYSASMAVKTALAHRITDEEYWPQGSWFPHSGYRQHAITQLTSAVDLGANLEEAVRSLDRGHPIYIAMRVPAGMACKAKAIDPDSAATKGGHAIAVVGYHLDESIKGGGYFILKNSWGANCGDNGYQYLSFHTCQRNDIYCYFWEIAGVHR